MIFVSQQKLAVILLYSLFIGVFLGVVYDIFRIRRLAFRTSGRYSTDEIAKKHRKFEIVDDFVIFFEDILFALISAVVICVFIFYMNSGQFRAIALAGAFLGFLIYYMTVGRLVMCFSGVIIRFIKFLIRKIFEYTLRPIKKSGIFIIRHTICVWYALMMTFIYRKQEVKNASTGYKILDTIKKERWNNEKAFKHIRKNRRAGVHSVLHSDDNKNAI